MYSEEKIGNAQGLGIYPSVLAKQIIHRLITKIHITQMGYKSSVSA